MPKSIVLFLFTMLLSTSIAIAQDDNRSDEGGFKKENLFTGGTVNLLFGSNMTSVGATPCIGYSFTNYLDAGLTFGIDYTAYRYYYVDGDRLRQTVLTPGAFVRLFPTSSLFAIANFEVNNVSFHYLPAVGDANHTEEKRSISTQSTLVGAGYASGRSPFQRSYYYLSVLWDVGNDPSSPYKDNLKRAVPVIRAGYNIALFQGRRR